MDSAHVLAAGDGATAAAEFQTLIDRRGIHWQFTPQLTRETGPLRAVAYVDLARAAVLGGDTASARKRTKTSSRSGRTPIPIFLSFARRREYAALR